METYAIPYFAGELTAQKAQTLYRAVQSLDPDSDHTDSSTAPMARVTFDIREANPDLAAKELRFYTVTLPISDDKNVIAEEPAASVYWISETADALVNTVAGPTLDPEAGGFRRSDNWPLLDLGDDRDRARNVAFGRIVGHEFTNSVFGYRDEEGDDFRRVVDHRLIGGTPLDASMLFDEYVDRYEDASSDGEPPSYQIVAQQLVHLETLSRANLLTGLDVPVEPTDTMTTNTSELDTSTIPAIREQRLESFLDRPLFSDPERRAAALAGVLVGQVSWHQEHERNMGRPLDTKTKGDQLTKNSLETALTAALEQAKIYAMDSDYQSEQDILFPETVDRLLEATEDMPTSWNIDKRELRFAYVLGHAHGRRSMPNAFEFHKSDKQQEAPAEN
jgi:CRISPR-associated protein Cas8b/Csh1 subtype I-B